MHYITEEKWLVTQKYIVQVVTATLAIMEFFSGKTLASLYQIHKK